MLWLRCYWLMLAHEAIIVRLDHRRKVLAREVMPVILGLIDMVEDVARRLLDWLRGLIIVWRGRLHGGSDRGDLQSSQFRAFLHLQRPPYLLPWLSLLFLTRLRNTNFALY
jgi:hypothetical protein